MHPIIAAMAERFAWQEAGYVAVLDGLPNDALNWQPAPETNSLAVLAYHAWSSTESWVTRAGGGEMPRDRDAEFGVTMGGTALAQVVRERAARVRAMVAALDADTLGAVRIAPGGRAETAAWCLLHAVEHNQEHLGQALLTRQLWETERGQVSPEGEGGYRISIGNEGGIRGAQGDGEERA